MRGLWVPSSERDLSGGAVGDGGYLRTGARRPEVKGRDREAGSRARPQAWGRPPRRSRPASRLAAAPSNRSPDAGEDFSCGPGGVAPGGGFPARLRGFLPRRTLLVRSRESPPLLPPDVTESPEAPPRSRLLPRERRAVRAGERLWRGPALPACLSPAGNAT